MVIVMRVGLMVMVSSMAGVFIPGNQVRELRANGSMGSRMAKVF